MTFTLNDQKYIDKMLLNRNNLIIYLSFNISSLRINKIWINILGTQKCVGCTIPCFTIPEHYIRTQRRNWKVERKGNFQLIYIYIF